MNLPPDLADWEPTATRPAPPEGPELGSGAILGLRALPSGKVLSLLGRDNYTLGRSIEGQAVIPDIDLGGFDAFEHGVSRLHAEIRLSKDGAYVSDLERANGTFVNGKRLDPQERRILRHGDIIQLGELRLQLISRFQAIGEAD